MIPRGGWAPEPQDFDDPTEFPQNTRFFETWRQSSILYVDFPMKHRGFPRHVGLPEGNRVTQLAGGSHQQSWNG